MFADRYPLEFKLYPYRRSVDQDACEAVHHPVVIVGAGPAGLAAALDLGLQGIPVVVLDDHEGAGQGSRAICFSKRSLEIADRYGCSGPMLAKGVVWNLGKVFHGDHKVFEFNLLAEDGHRFPAFINLQQPEFERFLFERLRGARDAGAPIELRGKNRVEAVEVGDDHVLIDAMTPEGPYTLEADWLIGCDGAGSPLRGMLGLGFEGRIFEDNFLIADVRMKRDTATERRFWFEPPFRSGDSALLHRQPDDIWRIDFQIGRDVDRMEEMKEESIRARIDRMLGPHTSYEIVWSSIYAFRCCRMQSFRHGRVIFAGDSAHQLSPFGARGANSGLQDVDNLGWKLALVMSGRAPERLLDTYSEERILAADENILNSTRTTDFITPGTRTSRIFRNAVLDLARNHAFARPMVNSGRLSVPATYDGLSLNGPDALAGGPSRSRAGSPCPDAPLGNGYLLSELGGRFTIMTIDAEAPERIGERGITAVRLALSTSDDETGALAERYLGTSGSAVYLIRPDQHVAARWDSYDETAMRFAIRTATLQE